MSVTPPDFRLAPQEDWIFGVKMRGSVLSFGPSGSDLAGAAFACFMMSGVGALIATTSASTINGYPVRNPAAMAVIGVAVIAIGVGSLVSALSVGVRADGDGVLIRRTWGRERIPWSSIRDVGVRETVPRHWEMRAGPNLLAWRVRPVASRSIGVVQRIDGSLVRLPGFVAAARDQGLSLGAETATELKVQALCRYRTHVTGVPLVPSTAVPSSIEEEPASHQTLAMFVGAALAVWLLVSWAAGSLVSPAFLILGIVVGFARRLLSR